MLSLRIVVLPGASAASTPARPTRRSMSWRMVSGVTRMTATLGFDTAAFEAHRRPGILLHDRQQARVEEPDLEQHEERDGRVDAVGQRVEDGPREVQPERELDQRLHR